MSIISCATLTHKRDKPNQDYCICFENKRHSFKGVIVADGLGDHYKSEMSSKFCAESLKSKLENIESLPICFRELFVEVKKDLKDFAEKELSQQERSKTNLGSTLICLIEFSDEFQIAYVGNGSIWQISGNFNHFNAQRPLPWNSINLLNPHNIEEDGQSKMFKYMSIADVNVIPSEIRLKKNEDSFGDIMVICTDGVFTSDEAKMGPDSKGVLWVMAEETMIQLYKMLDDLFLNRPNEITESDLQDELVRYLSFLKDNDIMDDDTTLGVLISEQAVLYQQGCWEKRKEIKGAANNLDN